MKLSILGLLAILTVTACDQKKEDAPTVTNTTTNANTNATASAVPVASNPGMADNTNAATNTGINDRDRNDAALTPTDQGGGADRDITAAVRKAVMGDGSLGYDAKNVKIITQAGKVTLRGPVKSDDEKKNIEAKAKAVNGVTSVDDQLEVKK